MGDEHAIKRIAMGTGEAASLRTHFSTEGEEPAIASWNEFCLYLPFPLTALSPWDEALVGAQVASSPSQHP